MLDMGRRTAAPQVGARLRVCAREIRIAAIVFVMAFRILAQILGVFLRGLLQAGRMCQRFQSGLPAP